MASQTKTLGVLFVFLLCGAGCMSACPSLPTFTAHNARDALADYMDAHPQEFSSPGRAESAREIRTISMVPVANGSVTVGQFQVDLTKRTYALYHWYGKPDSGWFEHWEWNGTFSLSADGHWRANPPQFMKEWGK